MATSRARKEQGKKRQSSHGQTGAKGINPDDPKVKPKWGDYETYEALIDSLKMEAKWKELLKDILRVAVKVGKRVVEVGKKVIEVILRAARKYPKTAATVIVGTALALIAHSIPLLGIVLGPLLAAVTLLVSGAVFANEAFGDVVLDALSPFKKATVA